MSATWTASTTASQEFHRCVCVYGGGGNERGARVHVSKGNPSAVCAQTPLIDIAAHLPGCADVTTVEHVGCCCCRCGSGTSTRQCVLVLPASSHSRSFPAPLDSTGAATAALSKRATPRRRPPRRRPRQPRALKVAEVAGLKLCGSRWVVGCRARREPLGICRRRGTLV